MKPKLVIIGLMLLLMVTMVSASKVYDPDTQTYSTYEWVIFDKYDIRLNEYKDKINTFYAEGDLILYKDYKVFKKLYYLDISGNKAYFKESDYKFYVNETYQWFRYVKNFSCEDADVWGNGTLTENCTEVEGEWIDDIKYRWREVNVSEKLPEGEHKWRIEGKKPYNRRVDFVIETDDEGDLVEWSWLNMTCQYKKNITALDGDNFPTFNVTYEAGKMNSDLSNIIFSNEAENTQLDFAQRLIVNDSYGLFTVNTTETEIYVYYDCENTVSFSSWNDTFGSPIYYGNYDTDFVNQIDLFNGTVNGTLDRVVGNISNAYDFERGDSDYIDYGDRYDISTGEMTVVAWVKAESLLTGDQFILAKDDNVDGRAYGFTINSAGTFGLVLQINGVNPASDSLTPLSAGNWYFVAATFRDSNNTVRYYLNGRSDGNTTNSGSMTDVSANFNIGRREFTGAESYFDGIIDDVIIYDRVLTEEEINNLYKMHEQSPTFGTEESLNEAPTVNLISPANDTTVNSNGYSAIFEYSVTDSDTAIDNCTLLVWNQSDDSLTYTQTNTSIVNGSSDTFNQVLMSSNYTWNVECVDDVGSAGRNATNYTINVISIPDEAPVVTLNSPANDTTYLTSPQSITFNCSAYDGVNLVNVSLIIDGSVNLTNSSGVNNTDYLFTPSAFNDGSYTWSCRGTDNESQQTQPTARNFIVDGNAPVVNITAPANGTIVTQFNQSITLNWTATDENLDSCFYGYDIYKLKFNDGDVIFSASPKVVSGWIYIADKDNQLFETNITLPPAKTGFVRISRNSGEFYNPSNLSTYQQISGGSYTNTSMTMNDNGWHYYQVHVTGSEADLFRVVNPIGFGINYTVVTCGDNTTNFNYPPENPNTLFISLFALDSVNNLGFDNVTLVKSTTAPQITITSPIASYDKVLNNTGLDLNITVTNTTVLDTCLYEYNGANNSVTCSNSISENLTYINGVNTVNVCINDTLGNANCTAKTWIVKVIETGVEFDNPVFEGSTQQFIFNITTDSTVAVAEAHLIYGDTINDTSTLRVSGNAYQLVNSIEIPDVLADENKTFYWEIVLSDLTIVNTTSNNQTVQPINIDDCSNYSVVLYNLTMYDEQTKTFITPGGNVSTNIEVDLEIFSTTGTTAFLAFNKTFNDTNPAQICLDQNLTADGYLGNLQVRYSATDKVTELYNIDKDPLNNGTVPKNVGLYPLNDTASTSFQIIYKGSEFLPIEGAIMQIKRKYIGEGDFTIVEAPKTDAEGKTVAHFEVENVVYTIVVVKDGVILDSFNNIVLRCSNPLTEECELKLDSFRSSTDFSNWDTLGDITYTTAFDEDARTVVAQFNTVSGSARTVRLVGTKFDGVGNVTICDESLFSSAGTLTCSVDSSYGNFTMITELFSQGETVTTAVVSFEDNIIDVLGNDTFFFVFFIVLIIPLLFITSTVGMVIAGIVGILFSMVILFVEATTIFSKGAALTWLIIAGLIIIWKITKRENI